MSLDSTEPVWAAIAVLVARPVLAALFVMAGLLYAAAHGPGRWLTVRRSAATAA
jgi:hypothetical protein